MMTNAQAALIAASQIVGSMLRAQMPFGSRSPLEQTTGLAESFEAYLDKQANGTLAERVARLEGGL